MSTSLHTVFILVSGNGDFISVISTSHGRKMRFSAGGQNSISEKLFFGHFEVIFLHRMNFSQGDVFSFEYI